MSRRAFVSLFVLVVSVLSLWQSPAARAQQNAGLAPAVSAPANGNSIDILTRGRQLEGQKRWGEALTLYEDALKLSPTDREIEQRAEWSKLHYDLGRRYNDATFRDSLASMPVRDALEQYSEVLLKIQSHYVEKPNWQGLADHGTAALDAALSDNVFVERNLPGVPQAKIDHFRRSLRVRLAGRPIETRQGAVDMSAGAARLAYQDLHLAESATVMEYICGATNSLDPYSAYLTAGQLNEVYSQIEGNFVGLGIELKAQDGALLIVKVISGSPAERGGMRNGDRIIGVNGRSTRELSTDQAANLLQGKEGSMVDVTIVTPGTAARVLRLRREQVEIPSVTNVKIVDPDLGVGYLQLTCFQKTTSRDLDAALWKLHRLGMRSLIMDLRGNPGGLLTTSVDVVDKFVERGMIVSTRGRSPQEDYSYTAQEKGTWRVPLVVLIDGDSASASEIFAGAIRDHHRGTIVGTRSYGKGSVQGIFPLNHSNAGLRLTTAKFYSPNGLPYSKVGVEPHVAVQRVLKPIASEDGSAPLAALDLSSPGDPAFDAALGVARQQLARR